MIRAGDTRTIVILERQNAHHHILELEQARELIQEGYDVFHQIMKSVSDSLSLSGKYKRYIDPYENGFEDIHSDTLSIIDNEIKKITDAL